MRNFSLGVGRRDAIIYTGATILVILGTIIWDLFLVELIGSQANNKYLLTIALFAFAFAIAFISAIAAGQRGRSRGMISSLLARYGLALQIFGIMITPIGLYYATNPTRSVPVGFAAFSSVIIGIIIAGVGGNMLVPRRA